MTTAESAEPEPRRRERVWTSLAAYGVLVVSSWCVGVGSIIALRIKLLMENSPLDPVSPTP